MVVEVVQRGQWWLVCYRVSVGSSHPNPVALTYVLMPCLNHNCPA